MKRLFPLFFFCVTASFGGLITGGGSGGGGGSGSIAGYTISTTAPADTGTTWLDSGSVANQAYPIRRYINGTWSPVSDSCDWWDTVGLVVSHGKPLGILASGQSNVGNAPYFPNDASTYTGDITVDKGVTYWDQTNTLWRVYDFATQQPPFVGVGASQLQTFAKLYWKRFGRSVRLVATREPAQGIAWWETGQTGRLNLIAAANASGIDHFDAFIWCHGEAGLGTSSFANYALSFQDFISYLRSQTWADLRLKVIGTSNNIGMLLTNPAPDSAEAVMRQLDTDEDPYAGWAPQASLKEVQFGASDSVHSTTREQERIGASILRTYLSLPRYDKKTHPAEQQFTLSGTTLTDITSVWPMADSIQDLRLSRTANSGQFNQGWGFNGVATSKLVANAQGSFGRADIELWSGGTSGAVATSADLNARFSNAGNLFTKPSLFNSTGNPGITTGTNNSGDSTLGFYTGGEVIPTATLAKTFIDAKAAGSFGYANLYFVLGASTPSVSTAAADSKFYIGNDGKVAAGPSAGNNLNAAMTIVQPALAGSLQPSLRVDAGAHTNANVSENFDVYFNGGRTEQFAAGTLALQRFAYFKGATVTGVGAFTITNAYGMYVDAPTASTNATITNNWALGVNGNAKIIGNLSLAPGTTTLVPISFTAGTNKTTPAAGDVEFDGTNFYNTANTTNSRMVEDGWQFFRLTGSGTGITTIADFFGATGSGIPMVSGGVYEIEWHCYFSQATAGTATWTITTATTALANLTAEYVGSPIAGIGTSGTPQTAGINVTSSSATAMPVTGTEATGATHQFVIHAIATAGAGASNTRLRLTMSAGTATPLINSYFKVRQLPAANIGVFSN